MALETIPVIPNVKSQREIWEISINNSDSFPPIHCIGFLGLNLSKPPFIPQYSGSTSQAVFLAKDCTVSLRAQFGPLQSDADDLNPSSSKKGNKRILIRQNIKETHLGLSHCSQANGD